MHGLGLVNGNLGLNWLREGQGSEYLEVLRVTISKRLDGLGLLGLDQLVLNLGLRSGSLEIRLMCVIRPTSSRCRR